MFHPEAPIYLEKCESYEVVGLKKIIYHFFEQMQLSAKDLAGKRVVIKPNLVRKMDASLGGTTHPAVLEACLLALQDLGADSVVIAESPGGLYTENALKSCYKVCGITDVAQKTGCKLNFDLTSEEISFEEGVVSKGFHIISPVAHADVVINLCKLKSHGLTVMTGAIKNLFGTIPGTEKFEMHARFPDIQDFCSMILDLASLHTKRTRVISLTDGIVGMEGNGPTNGKARKIGILAASENPFALDAVCADLLGLTDKVLMLRLAKERKLYEQEKLCVIGSSVESCRISDFCLPDSRSHASLLSNRKLMHYFEPRPAINVEKCVGCGECARSCPKHTIRMINGKDGRRQARIDHSACIKCFCCQELCPHDAVKIKQNFLLKFLK